MSYNGYSKTYKAFIEKVLEAQEVQYDRKLLTQYSDFIPDENNISSPYFYEEDKTIEFTDGYQTIYFITQAHTDGSGDYLTLRLNDDFTLSDLTNRHIGRQQGEPVYTVDGNISQITVSYGAVMRDDIVITANSQTNEISITSSRGTVFHLTKLEPELFKLYYHNQ
jgi:hypothetical protein